MKRSSRDILVCIPENKELARLAYAGASPQKITKPLPEDGSPVSNGNGGVTTNAASSMFLRPDSVHATSFDIRCPASNVLDGQVNTDYWVSTGLYPQELMMKFNDAILLSRVVVACAGVRSMSLKWCLAASSHSGLTGERRELRQAAMPPVSDHTPIVVHHFDVGGSPCDTLMLTIERGYDEHVTVFKLECWGKPDEYAMMKGAYDAERRVAPR